jgi:hypothetical protein
VLADFELRLKKLLKLDLAKEEPQPALAKT